MDDNAVSVKKVHTKELILGITCFTTVIAAGVIVRLMFGRYLQFELDTAYMVSPFDRYYDPAYIGDNGYIYTDYFSLKGMYLMLCSCCFKLLGNVDGAVILLNILIELIAVTLIYFAVKRVFGTLAAFIIALICDLCPYWGELPGLWGGTRYLILWREYRLIFLLVGLILYLLSFIKPIIISAGNERAFDEKLERLRVENTDTDTDDEVRVSAPVITPGEIAAVELLKSPLPLPKRHEHKDIDYDYEVRDTDMRYDIEPDEADMHYDYE